MYCVYLHACSKPSMLGHEAPRGERDISRKLRSPSCAGCKVRPSIAAVGLQQAGRYDAHAGDTGQLAADVLLMMLMVLLTMLHAARGVQRSSPTSPLEAEPPGCRLLGEQSFPGHSCLVCTVSHTTSFLTCLAGIAEVILLDAWAWLHGGGCTGEG